MPGVSSRPLEARLRTCCALPSRAPVGNSCVEHLTGTVHLYRQVLSREEAAGVGPRSLPVRCGVTLPV